MSSVYQGQDFKDRVFRSLLKVLLAKNKMKSHVELDFFLFKVAHWSLLIWSAGRNGKRKGKKGKRWRVDLILLSGLQPQDICHTDVFDWWESIYLEGLWAVSKFIFPTVPSSISASTESGPRLSANTLISYFKTRHSKTITLFFCICTPNSSCSGCQHCF